MKPVVLIAPDLKISLPLWKAIYVQGNAADPYSYGQEIGRQLNEIDPRERAIDIRLPFGTLQFDADYILWHGWPDASTWWSLFWKRLNSVLKRRLFTAPIRVGFMDYEDAPNCHDRVVSDGFWVKWNSDSAAMNRLPAFVRADPSRENFDQWAFAGRADALRWSVCRTFCNELKVKVAPFGNFNDCLPETRDGLGRPTPQAAMSFVDNPECYIRQPFDLWKCVYLAQKLKTKGRELWPEIESPDLHEMPQEMTIARRREIWTERNRMMAPFVTGFSLWCGSTTTKEELDYAAEFFRSN